MYKIIIVLIFSPIFGFCQPKSSASLVDSESVRSVKERWSSLNLPSSTFYQNRYISVQFKKYYTEIIQSLNDSLMPECLQDPCLDYNKPYYTYRGSHAHFSLREDLINGLPIYYLSILYSISQRITLPALNQLCNKNPPDKSPHDVRMLKKSTWELIEDRYRSFEWDYPLREIDVLE